MNTLLLSIIGGAAAIAIIGIIIFWVSINSGPVTQDEKQRILLFCQNPEIITENGNILVICHHPTNSTEMDTSNLPSPVYKRTRCVSTHGCFEPYSYIPQIPDDLLTPQQKQDVINKVLQVTRLKEKYPEIEFDSIHIEPTGDRWFANIQFVIPHIMNGSGHCGWYTSNQIDLQIGDVYPNQVPIGNKKC